MGVPGRYHTVVGDRVRCDVCPRECTLRPGQRGFCYVRRGTEDGVELTTYGRSSGFCIDPIEKKPLNHYLPGSAVLSFGTAGCNLGCRFCQNWEISKARANDRLQDTASPTAIAAAARRHGCRSVAFTYNDPVIFTEYATDTAAACREAGVATVAVTARARAQDRAARIPCPHCEHAVRVEARRCPSCHGALEPQVWRDVPGSGCARLRRALAG